MNQTMMKKKYISMLLGGTFVMVVGVLLTAADSIIAGQIHGEDALLGVNLITPIFSTVNFLGLVFSIGIPIMYTKLMGSFDAEQAKKVFGLGLATSVLVGLIVCVFCISSGDMYLSFFDAQAEVVEHARKYLTWAAFCYLLMPLQTYISSMVMADGDEVLTTVANIIEAAGNIPLSIILSHHIGVAGISLASLICIVLSLAILMIHFKKKSNTLKFNLYFSFGMIKSVIRYSIIDASSYFFLGIYTLVIEKLIIYRFGNEMDVIASVLVFMAELGIVFDGIGEAISPIINMYFGEGSYRGIKNIYSLARKTAIIEGVAMSVLMALLAPVIPWVLGVTSSGAVSVAITGVRIISFGYIFTAILYLASSYYLLREKIALGVFICALRDVLIVLPVAGTLGLIFGMYAMFVGVAVSPFIAVAIGMTYTYRKYGKDEYPLLIDKMEKESDYLFFEIDVIPNEVIRIRDEIEEELRCRGYSEKIINKTLLLTEEMFMYVYELNKGKKVMGECTVNMREDHIEFIEKDDGKTIDLTDEDMPLDSFGAYIISSMEHKWFGEKQHLMMLTCNRNVFEVHGGK